MKEKLFQLKSYSTFLLKARTRYGTHSPFVYQILEECFFDDRNFYAFDHAEYLRELMLAKTTTIELSDFGAGSRNGQTNTRKISDIAKYAATSAKEGRLLFKLINFFQPKTGIELGTSLGVGTLYQALASTDFDFYTLEGDPKIAAIAQNNLDTNKLNHVQLRVGQFKDTYVPLCKELKKKGQTVDYFYIDGNHQKQATINYFLQALEYSSTSTFMIFDDIRWSADMYAAWQEIIGHKSVSLSLELFNKGIVFLKKRHSKEHFFIRY